jgi:predicted ATP-grasp superfamily ATP-dependent carboligase
MSRKRSTYPPAVVVGTCVNALCTIRSLGRRGVSVFAIDVGSTDYGAKSRYCQVQSCKSLYRNALVDLIVDIGRALDEKAVLFCTSDTAVLDVSNHREEIEKYYHFVLPPHHVIETLMRKTSFNDFAIANGFLVPRTFVTQGEEEIRKVADKMSYPCLIKPDYRDDSWNSLVSSTHKVLLAESKKAFISCFDKHNISNRNLIIQEWIEGGDENVYFCLLYVNREFEPLALFTGKKIRQYPVLTGSTSFAESVWVPSIAKDSLRLLKTAGCKGLCSVEFKQSRKDQRFYITEPTVARSDTQEGISVCSGMDIPFVAYLDAIGKNPEPLRHFKEGVKWINEPLDFYSIQRYLRNGKIKVKECIISYKGKRAYGLWALDDPLPFTDFVWDKIKSGGRRLIL